MQSIKNARKYSPEEAALEDRMLTLFRKCPLPSDEVLQNLGLFIRRKDLQRILFMNELYKKILDVHGVAIEFGPRWGQNLALMESFRGMYEPYNHTRKIVGFDTFEGFPAIHKKDGDSVHCKVGAYSVTKGYEKYLEEIMDYHEKQSPISHIKKYELIKGNAMTELEKYLKANPETIVAFAYFDLDLYEPTKRCLELIAPRVTRGTVLGFDELNVHGFPGETDALKEVFGLGKYKVERNIYSSCQSYLVIC
jgi:hypothetical protein